MQPARRCEIIEGRGHFGLVLCRQVGAGDARGEARATFLNPEIPRVRVSVRTAACGHAPCAFWPRTEDI